MKKIILSGLLFLNLFFCQAQTVPIAMQWHYNGNIDIWGDWVDWTYSVYPTQKREYICCGYTNGGGWPPDPSIFKLDNHGRIIWHKQVTFTGCDGGSLRQVIKTPNGYAAIGFGKATSGSDKILIVEFDEDGNYLNSTPVLRDVTSIPANHTLQGCHAYTGIMDPNNQYYLVGGDVQFQNNSGPQIYRYAHVTKISYSTLSVSASYVDGGAYKNDLSNTYGGNMIEKVIAKTTSGSSYNVYACGYKSNTNDNYAATGLNKDGDNVSISKKDKDIWLLSLSHNLNMVTSDHYSRTYTKGSLPTYSFYYNEAGPATARDLTNTSCAGNKSPIIRDNLKESVNLDERGADMIFTNDGKIAILASVNGVYLRDYGDGNGSQLFHTGSGNTSITDDVKNPDYVYDEMVDADAFLLKIDPSDGDIEWDKNVAHFSSMDYTPRIVQDNDDNYVIAGSCSDNVGSSDIVPVSKYDAYIIATTDNSTAGHLWRRTFHAAEEGAICVFALAKTADGGYIIGGDNDLHDDDYSVTKLAPPCAPQASYDVTGTSGVYTVGQSGTIETWNTNKTVSAKVIVPSGKVLKIEDCTISFASSDHMYDYNEFTTSGSTGKEIGITVQPGGTLYVENATLKGIDECGVDYMWDGIVIEGNKNASQFPPSNHGILDLDGATIKDARYGISVGETPRIFYSTNSQPGSSYASLTSDNYSSRYWPNGKKGGGRVDANNSTFEDCRFAVNQQMYYKENSRANYENCDFLANGPMKDICFYPGEDGNGEPTEDFFAAYLVSGLVLEGNDFYCNTAYSYNKRSRGIVLSQASGKIRRTCNNATCPGNTFTNLRTGIEISGSPISTTLPVNLYGGTFDNCGMGILLNATQLPSIQDNTFKVPDYSNYVTDFATGLKMVGCKSYDVYFNTFTKCTGCTNGIGNVGFIVNSGTYDDERIYRNNFDDNHYASVAMQRNGDGTHGFQWKCNDYGEGDLFNAYRLSHMNFNGSGSTHPAVVKQSQGACLSITSPAGNRFYTNCFYPNTNLAADPSVIQPVAYNYHISSTPYDPDWCIHPKYAKTDCNKIFSSHEDACALYSGGSSWSSTGFSGTSTLMYASLSDFDAAVSSMSSGEEGYDYVLAEQYMQVSELGRYLCDQEDYASAATLFENYNRYDEALTMYMFDRDWTGAASALGMLPTSTQEEVDYKWVCAKAIELFSNDETWFDLDSAERDSLHTIIAPDSYVGYVAEGIEALIENRAINWPEPLFDTSDHGDTTGSGAKSAPIHNVNGKWKQFNEEKKTFAAYPNPTNGNFTVLAEDDGILFISCIDGRVICEYPIHMGQTDITLPKTITDGIYVGRFRESKSNKIHVLRIVYHE